MISKDANEMAKHAGSFDFILDAVAAQHDINAYINMLARDGNLTMVGAPDKPLPVGVFGLHLGRRSFSGSCIGGIAETQEMLDFCAEHNIVADVEVIPIQKINEAYERLVKSDVKYRFSIDMASLKVGVMAGPRSSTSARLPRSQTDTGGRKGFLCKSAHWENAIWKFRLSASAAWA